MAEKIWTPTEDWSGAGEYRVPWRTCPRCGSRDVNWGAARRGAKKTFSLGECRTCGLTFKEVARTEMLDEGCYDTEPITLVEQSDLQ